MSGPVLLQGKQFYTYLRWWHHERHLARTDLLWLCNVVLGYKDVSREVHGPILDALQHFPGATEFHKSPSDLVQALQGKVLWEPKCQMEQLPWNEGWEADRQNLYLYPRGHLKSTLITVAHSIQWMLNYPNVRILLTTATETLVTAFVIEIRQHLIQNEYLRTLFPEHCPIAKDGKVPELGNLSGFTLPCRDNTNKKLGPGGKEPTVLASTVGSSITGYHGDVQKTDDPVEKINSSSQNGIDDVIRHFGSMGDLLEKYNSDDVEKPLKGWVDMVGTPWDFSDLYQVVRNSEGERIAKGLPPMWNLCIRSAAPNWPEGPYLWPQRMGFKALKEIEDDPTKGPAQLSAQYLMNPIVAGQGLIEDVKKLRWMPELDVARLIPSLTLTAALDLAGMDQGAKGADNDYTCLTVGGFGDGRLLVPWMRYGRPPVEEVIEWIFDVFKAFPQIQKLKIEKEAHARVLESFLRREMSSRNVWLPLEFMPRNNQQSKQQKIRGLRPWFQDGKIVFSEGLAHRTAIESEIKGFPKFRHDDFLDTLTDLMHEARGGITSGVLVDQQDFETKVFTSPIAMLLAQHEYEHLHDTASGFDLDTGFPT
jgi:hypothetical protein